LQGQLFRLFFSSAALGSISACSLTVVEQCGQLHSDITLGTPSRRATGSGQHADRQATRNSPDGDKTDMLREFVLSKVAAFQS
jgi:hypothetical protein